MVYEVFAGAGAVTSGTTSSQLAQSCSNNKKKNIESLTIYPTDSDVTIDFGDGYTATVTANMKGHTFVATNGNTWNKLNDFTINTDCEAGWVAF